ncbi:unnamed protein product [Cyprideis torosa]|uniref:Uncharacterized protein n=1 Tax=Cyprideis torosa TaxID=163714 RepID=A0A7R8ZLV4_9CRUS|nr:unnamed protein product [Cyprideis torosa]CAG0884518.1 unnamed protein product [Cyprideis torosa]
MATRELSGTRALSTTRPLKRKWSPYNDDHRLLGGSPVHGSLEVRGCGIELFNMAPSVQRRYLVICVLLALFTAWSDACPDLCQCVERGNNMDVHCSGLSFPSRNLNKTHVQHIFEAIPQNDIQVMITSYELEELDGSLFIDRKPQRLKFFSNKQEELSISDTTFDNMKEELRELRVDRSKLKDFPFHKIADLNHLQNLTLFSNQLTKIPVLDCKDSALQTLDVHDNSINSVEGETFATCYNLQVLDLSRNELTELPESLKCPPSLTELYLQDNQINSAHPSSLVNCESLSNINLARNELKKLPPLPSSLKTLDASENLVDSLDSASLKNGEALEDINLSGNRIRQIPSLMCGSSLRRLTLRGNIIASIEQDTFTNCDSLEILDLSDNSIVSLPNPFPCPPSLRILDLSGNQIIELAPDTFKNCESLEELRLAQNILGYLPDLECPPSLVKLDLSYNRVNGFDDTVFSQCSGLQTVDLTENRLIHMPPCGPAFRNMHLSDNEIRNIRNPNLEHCEFLEKIDLSNNFLEELPQFMCPPSMQMLDLSDNKLSKVPTESFVECPTLFALHMQNNRIFNTDPRAFAGLIELRYLRLEGNKLEQLPPGSFFMESPFLLEMDLSENNISLLEPNAFFGVIGEESTVNLAGNRIKFIYLSSVATLLENGVSINLSENPLDCTECDLAWMPRARQLLSGHCENYQSLDELRPRDFRHCRPNQGRRRPNQGRRPNGGESEGEQSGPSGSEAEGEEGPQGQGPPPPRPNQGPPRGPGRRGPGGGRRQQQQQQRQQQPPQQQRGPGEFLIVRGADEDPRRPTQEFSGPPAGALSRRQGQFGGRENSPGQNQFLRHLTQNQQAVNRRSQGGPQVVEYVEDYSPDASQQAEEYVVLAYRLSDATGVVTLAGYLDAQILRDWSLQMLHVKIRDCTFLHDHRGTKVGLQLLPDQALRLQRNKEAYFSRYIQSREQRSIAFRFPLSTSPADAIAIMQALKQKEKISFFSPDEAGRFGETVVEAGLNSEFTWDTRDTTLLSPSLALSLAPEQPTSTCPVALPDSRKMASRGELASPPLHSASSTSPLPSGSSTSFLQSGSSTPSPHSGSSTPSPHSGSSTSFLPLGSSTSPLQAGASTSFLHAGTCPSPLHTGAPTSASTSQLGLEGRESST